MMRSAVKNATLHARAAMTTMRKIDIAALEVRLSWQQKERRLRISRTWWLAYGCPFVVGYVSGARSGNQGSSLQGDQVCCLIGVGGSL